MMAQRTFRIESFGRGLSNGGDGSAEPSAVLDILSDIKTMLQQGVAPAEGAAPQQDESFFVKYREELSEAVKLKMEMDSIQDAISETKSEIATLRYEGLTGSESARVSDELEAVVKGTEHATEAILSAAEIIDENAGNLAANLNGHERDMINDIQENVVQVFEACNFQDVTGQRITKVVRTFGFIEERVDRMMEIWGGIESFSGIDSVDAIKSSCESGLASGPSLHSDQDVASQDDIDALFD